MPLAYLSRRDHLASSNQSGGGPSSMPRLPPPEVCRLSLAIGARRSIRLFSSFLANKAHLKRPRTTPRVLINEKAVASLFGILEMDGFDWSK